MNDELNTRYVLTELGMRSLAARAGVPRDTFARHGGVTFLDPTEADDPSRVIRHRKHTIGVNRFFARLAADARHGGWHLNEWRNEAESTRRFVDENGRTSWIRPDGSGVLVRGRQSRAFLLEYDRGTLDAGDYPAKFEGYRRYFEAGAWQEDFDARPAVLFVCADDGAEERVARACRASAGLRRAWFTTEWRFERDTRNQAGLLGRVWLPVAWGDRSDLEEALVASPGKQNRGDTGTGQFHD